jgi:hypothetical protein
MIVVLAQLLITFNFASSPSPALWHTLASEIEHSEIDKACWRVARHELVEASSVPVTSFTVDVRGKCELPYADAAWNSNPLGWVNVVNGEWTPQVHLDCTRIAEAVRRAQEGALCNLPETTMARAMAVVVRHELHHLLRKTREHSSSGEFRASLNSEDLILPPMDKRCER